VRRWATGHTLWTSPQSGIISAGPEEIEHCIARKEDRIAVYRQDWDEVWLLIHATDYYLSGTLDLLPEAMNAEYVTDFDQVHVLQAPHQAIKLTLRRPT
jgi:hypothetical protein